MSDKKIYCGSGKRQSDTWLKVTINPDKFKEYIQVYEGNKYVKLNINIKAEPNQYDKDVEITVDTFKAEKQVKNDIPDVAPSTKDDLPF